MAENQGKNGSDSKKGDSCVDNIFGCFIVFLGSIFIFLGIMKISSGVGVSGLDLLLFFGIGIPLACGGIIAKMIKRFWR